MISLERQIYICKYHDVDKEISYSLELSRKRIKEELERLRQNGLYEKYRNMSEEEYEKVIEEEQEKSKLKKMAKKEEINNIVGTAKQMKALYENYYDWEGLR